MAEDISVPVTKKNVTPTGALTARLNPCLSFSTLIDFAAVQLENNQLVDQTVDGAAKTTEEENKKKRPALPYFWISADPRPVKVAGAETPLPKSSESPSTADQRSPSNYPPPQSPRESSPLLSEKKIALSEDNTIILRLGKIKISSLKDISHRPFPNFLPATIDIDYLANQIVKYAQLSRKDGKLELLLGLKPENLGNVWLSFSWEEGKLSITITASPAAREILERKLPELKDILQNANLNISQLQVSVGQFAPPQNYSSFQEVSEPAEVTGITDYLPLTASARKVCEALGIIPPSNLYQEV